MAQPSRPPLPFSASHPVVGMVHVPALPGAPGFSGDLDAIMARVATDARHLREGGVDGIMVENYGDTPFYPDSVPPETVAGLTRAVLAASEAAQGLPVGVNVLRNDAQAALGIAAAAGADFIRVNVHVGTMWTDQGPLSGRAHETLRRRSALGIDCPVLADVHVKHATPPQGEAVEDAARDAWFRGGASALIVSGAGTGLATNPDRVRRVAAAVPEAPVWIGSGVESSSLAALWPHAAGFIVGSTLQADGVAGNPVEPGRVRSFMETVQRLRDSR